MTPKFTITRDKIRTHFNYFWWQYFLLLVLAIFGWNLLYTTTHYRSPEHLKMEWYYEGPTGNNTQKNAEQLLLDAKEKLFPHLEETSFATVGMDETYGPMQLMVWMAAGQGDLYMLKTESFTNNAAQGAMVDLQPYVDDGTLNVEGMDLKKGMVKLEGTNEKHLYGIPAKNLPKFIEYEILPDDTVLSILASGGNTENTVKLLAHFLEIMK